MERREARITQEDQEMTIILEWDLLKIVLINMFPNFGRETARIIELVHK